MKSLAALSSVFLLFGCATASQDLVQRRADIRRYNEGLTARPDPSYRSADGVRGTTWGMTPEEVIAVRGEPEQRSESVLMYRDQVDTSLAPTTYGFFEGHLAVVKSHFDAGLATTSRLEQGLTRKYGAPASTFDKYEEAQKAVNEAVGVDIALSVLAGVAVVAGHGSHDFPLFWGPPLGDAVLVRQSLSNAQKPALLETWRVPETDVHLTAFDSGTTDITWASRALGGGFWHAQASAAGLEQLGKSL